MNKLFIAIVLFLLALTAIALDPIYSLVKQPIDLTKGITITQPEQAYNDFSKPVSDIIIPDATRLWMDSQTPLQPYTLANGWYHLDFPEQPFDGRIDVLVMGEPLPTPIVSLLLMLGVAGLCYIKQRWSVV